MCLFVAGVAAAATDAAPWTDAEPVEPAVLRAKREAAQSAQAPTAPNACPSEYEPNDSAGAALPFPMTTGALNLVVCPLGDEDWFSVSMQAGGAYRVETYDIRKVDVTLDTRLHLYAPDGTTELATNDDRAAGSAEVASSVLTYTPASAGTYFVRARHRSNSQGGENHQYTLRVTDVCNDIHEPDDSSAQAPPLALGRVTMRTSCSAADEDWAKVSLVGGVNYRFETYVNPGADTVLTLFGTDGTTVLKTDDDAGIGSASFMTYTPAATGDYFVRAKAFAAGNAGPGKHYQLLAIASAGTALTIGSPCTEAQLDAALALSRPGYTITFDCGTGPGISPFIFPFSAMKYLTPTLTFDGGGAVAFSGLRTNRLFWQVAGNSATFRNIGLVRGGGRLSPGGGENAGGAVLAYGALTFENADLSRNSVNTAIYGGGAIYTNGPLTLTNSTLNYNTSGGGGALYLDSASRTVIQGSQFISNASYGLYGGGITNIGLLTMTNSLMQSNELSRTVITVGDEGGGAIANYAAGTVALANTTLAGNVSVWRGGGVLNFGRLSVTGGEMRDNIAVYRGGGVFNTWNDTSGTKLYPGELTIDSVRFLRNKANAAAFPTSGNGGGLLQNGTAVVRRAHFEANSAGDRGGAVYGAGPTSISDGSMVNNTAGSGGAVNVFRESTWITGTAFVSNTASSSGGAIYVQGLNDGFGGDGRATVSGARFDRNSAGSGGALGAFGPTVVDRSTFVRNSAVSGGAIASGGAFGAGSLSVARTLLEQNTASTQAGALYVLGGTARITNTTLSANQAPSGGGLYGSGGTVTLLNVSIVDSGASGLHGAGSAIAITNTLISRDLAVSGSNCAGSALVRAYNSISNDITCQLTTVTPAGNNADSNSSLLLGPLAWNGGLSKTYLPGPGSSAIDRSPIGPSDDQRGAPRAFGLGYDVGAVEVGPTVPNVLPLNVFVPATQRDASSGW